MFLDFFENGIVNSCVNETYIYLNPKKAKATKVSDYRPISSVTSLYKTVAKVLARRLRGVLDWTVSENQSAFVAGRQVMDPILMANELVDEYKVKKKQGWILKLDLEKAYDMVDWDFLLGVLHRKDFEERWISNMSFSIIINGKPHGRIKASRVGPFFICFCTFFICSCSFMVGANKVHVNHLQFADDTLIFSEDDTSLLTNLKDMVCCFEAISGLRINMRKTQVAFVNVSEEKLAAIASTSGCEASTWPLFYLGMPLGGTLQKVFLAAH